jgi:peptidoglycan hydrolase CwlO-like protein
MRRLVSSVIVMMFVVASFSAVGCHRNPNEKELQLLDETRNAALSAENTVADKKNEKSRLESQLSQKNKELQETKNELELVKQRLAE